MSFAKAEQLLALAAMTAANHRGVTIADVIDRFAVSKRTAQRMLRALENQFPSTATIVDEAGHKRWMLRQSVWEQLLTMTAEELAAFDLAAEAIMRSGALVESQHLQSMRDKIFAFVPKEASTRIEPDHEALLEAHGFVVRPGPKPWLNIEVGRVLAHAIKANYAVKLTYQLQSGRKPFTRIVAPYGIITGMRRYLVGCALKDKFARYPKLYVIENIRKAEVLAEPFERSRAFNLQRFCERSFGVFQNDSEASDVALRFSPAAADRARKFTFHPNQTVEDAADGSVVVRFRAAGILEMTWHLYMWGVHVEVLSPAVLHEMVDPYRRKDFISLP